MSAYSVGVEALVAVRALGVAVQGASRIVESQVLTSQSSKTKETMIILLASFLPMGTGLL